MDRVLVLAMTLVAAVAACAPGGAEPSTSAAAPAETPGVAPAEVAGSWQLIQIGEAAVDAIAIPTLEVTDTGAASGSAGCNQFSGSVVVSADEIRFGPLATTKMACGKPIDALEARYLAALSAARTWTINGEGNLVIEGGDRLVLQPAAR